MFEDIEILILECDLFYIKTMIISDQACLVRLERVGLLPEVTDDMYLVYILIAFFIFYF